MKPWHRSAIYIIAWTAAAVLALVTSAYMAARAEWKPEYANSPPEVRDWYRNAQLTPEATARLGWRNCCDHSDVVRTKFRVSKDGADAWEWLDPESQTWRLVPADIIHHEERAPGGLPVLFVYKGTPTCFYLPEGGI